MKLVVRIECSLFDLFDIVVVWDIKVVVLIDKGIVNVKDNVCLVF